MLGSAALFGSKGMVRTPNLSGLSSSAAVSAIQAAGLIASSSGTVDTGDSGLNGKIASQSPSSNTLVDYESTVSYTTYNYVAPPPSCTAGWTFTGYGEWSAWSTCSNSSQSRSRAILGYYTDSNCNQSGIQQYDTQTETQSCSSCNVGGNCSVGYACSRPGCSFCCPDLCYQAGTWSSGCVCQTSGLYFC